MTFLEHLEELRKRILYSLVALCVAAFAGFFFSQRVIDLLTRPVPNLVFLAPAEAFVVQLKVALVVGAFIAAPRLDNLARKTAYRSYFFMKEATPWFFAGALGVGVLQVTGLLTVWQNALAPLTVGWLQLPREAATAFVMGMVRRDFGAAGLYDLTLSTYQIVVALVTITLFVPCIASLMVMLKERGWKESLLVWGGTWIGAFLVGGMLSQILL